MSDTTSAGMPIRTAFRRQARACKELGSPFTAKLLNLLADDLSEQTPVGKAVLDWPGDPSADALALRLAGALHALVLTGESAALTHVYPPTGKPSNDLLKQAIEAALVDHEDTILRFIDSPPQTNEVARSAVLAGGFLTVAAQTSLPLAILEIGSSAGLNLNWDSFSYNLGGLNFGQACGRPLLAPDWEGPQPPNAEVVVNERAGCDRAPIDLGSEDEVLRLRAYIWPDQPHRMTRLDQALEVAGAKPISIASADAADWIASHLKTMRDGIATILFHSIVWQYIPKDRQERLEDLIAHAGNKATSNAPFAWLRMEPETANAASLRLTLWPHGQTRHLADVDYHGRWVRWHVEPKTLLRHEESER